ncbi:hypothetical protein [Cobetia marina]|uniref:hypothetical protein n=1 Tax=Cobetia marina TaxID=28258 RepID=UPI0038578094
MQYQIPNPVIGTVAPIIADYYYNHSTLNSLFRKCGAPGDVPAGNCEKKCSDWLIRCSEDEGTDALLVLGEIIKDFMNKKQDPVPSLFDDGPSKKSEMQHGKKKSDRFY